MDDHAAVNRAFWDEIAPHHAASSFYAVEQFLTRPDTLGAIETAELGPLAGLSVCHLQRHIGLDSLSLVGRGATVTGVDFSAVSLRVARDLSRRTGLPADFVRADVLGAADVLDTRFDLVFTTRGVLMWVGDLDRWARSCARLLHPDGVFYLLDIHPLAMTVHATSTGLSLSARYFGGGRPAVVSKDASYAVSDVGLVHRETREWIHPLGDVVTALITAGLVIDFLHEHPAEDDASEQGLPALYSLRARRPA